MLDLKMFILFSLCVLYGVFLRSIYDAFIETFFPEYALLRLFKKMNRLSRRHDKRGGAPLWEQLPRFRCASIPISSIDRVFEKDEKSKITVLAEIETNLSPSQAMALLRKKLNEVNAGCGMEVLGIKFDVKESNGIN